MHFSSWKCYKSNCYISYHNWTILSHFVHAIYYTCNLLHAIIFIYSMPFVDSFAANTASVCVKVSRCVCEVFECVFYVWCGLWCPGAGCSGQWGWLQMCVWGVWVCFMYGVVSGVQVPAAPVSEDDYRCVCEVFECVFYVWCGLWCPGAGRSGQWGWLQMCVWGVWVCVLCMVWSLVSRCRPLRSVRMTTDVCVRCLSVCFMYGVVSGVQVPAAPVSEDDYRLSHSRSSALSPRSSEQYTQLMTQLKQQHEVLIHVKHTLNSREMHALFTVYMTFWHLFPEMPGVLAAVHSYGECSRNCQVRFHLLYKKQKNIIR